MKSLSLLIGFVCFLNTSYGDAPFQSNELLEPVDCRPTNHWLNEWLILTQPSETGPHTELLNIFVQDGLKNEVSLFRMIDRGRILEIKHLWLPHAERQNKNVAQPKSEVKELPRDVGGLLVKVFGLELLQTRYSALNSLLVTDGVLYIVGAKIPKDRFLLGMTTLRGDQEFSRLKWISEIEKEMREFMAANDQPTEAKALKRLTSMLYEIEKTWASSRFGDLQFDILPLPGGPGQDAKSDKEKRSK